MIDRVIYQYPTPCGSYPYVKKETILNDDGNYEIREVSLRSGIAPNGKDYDFCEYITIGDSEDIIRQIVKYNTGQPLRWVGSDDQEEIKDVFTSAPLT